MVIVKCVGPDSTTGVLMQRDRDTSKEGSSMKKEAEIEEMLPQGKEHQGLLATTRS